MLFELNEFQKKNKVILLELLNLNRYCLDCSIPGSGKTTTCISVIKEFNRPTIIICPKQVINMWLNMKKINNLTNIIDIINYDKIKMGNTKYFTSMVKYKKNFFPLKCMKKDNDNDNSNINNDKEDNDNSNINNDNSNINNDNNDNSIDDNINNINLNKNEWKLPKDTLIIFDEVHYMKNYKTQISNLLNTLDIKKYYIYGISGTIANAPINLVSLFKTFGIINNPVEFLLNTGYKKASHPAKGFVFTNDEEKLKKLHYLMFKNKETRVGVRTSNKEFEKLMPEQIIYVINLKLNDILNS